MNQQEQNNKDLILLLKKELKNKKFQDNKIREEQGKNKLNLWEHSQELYSLVCEIENTNKVLTKKETQLLILELANNKYAMSLKQINAYNTK